MEIKHLTQFHEDPAVIAWWCARLRWAFNWLTPFRRRSILVAGAIYVAVSNPLSYLEKAQGFPVPNDLLGSALVVLAIFCITWLIYQAAVRFNSLPTIVRRHPQLTMHLLFWGLLAIIWNTTPADGLWRAILLGVVFFLPKLIWRCGYMLSSGQNGRAAGTSFFHQLICLFPVYGGTNTPYGKGLDFLSKFEAKTVEELTRSQLAGIKLLILACLWQLGLVMMEGFVYGPGNHVTRALGGHTIGIPKLEQLLTLGAGAPRYTSWASIYCELIWQVLRMARNGHGVIAVLRLFGFNVFRNTYKPLLAESIHEFWNRYYYYFKELLVHFFFMPVFMQLGSKPLGRIFHNWPRLRLFAAVFAAAFVGNMYYHLLYRKDLLAYGDVLGVIYSARNHFFYAFVLAIGIYVSMLRKERRGGKPLSAATAARMMRIFGVWTFFSLIFIWDLKSSTPFFTRVHFFLNLFGLA